MSTVRPRPDRTIDRFAQDAAKSFTLAARYYTDPDIAERERHAIFASSWQMVCHASDVADQGQYHTATIAGERLFVVRDEEGVLRAFFNVCLHRGHSILQGQGRLNKLMTCPYHAWVYDTSGRLKGARMSDRMADFDYDDFQLADIAVQEFCGFVFVNLATDAAPMEQVYPGVTDEILARHPNPATLRLASSSTFNIAGNWKNVGDNLLECYHCHPSHKAFVDLIDMSGYRNETYDNWSIQTGRSNEANQVYEVASGAQGFASIFLWPNVSIGQLPGQRGLFIFHFEPAGPESTLQTLRYYSPDGQRDDVELKAMDYFNNVLGPEDVDLVEDVQVGLRSAAYHQGRFICIPDRPEISEHAVHHFHSMVRAALGVGGDESGPQ